MKIQKKKLLNSLDKYNDVARISSMEDASGFIAGKLDDSDRKYVDCTGIEHDQPNAAKKVFGIGTAGSGKIGSTMLPNIRKVIDRGESLFITSMKNELYPELESVLKAKGYLIKNINFCDSRHSDVIDCMKMLREIQDEEKQDYAADLFAQALVSDRSGSSFQIGHLLVKAFILRILADPDLSKREKSLHTLYQWISSKNIVYDCKRLFNPANPNAVLYRKSIDTYQEILDLIQEPEELETLAAALSDSLQLLKVPAIDELLSSDRKDSMEFNLLQKRPCAYFLSYPAPNVYYKPFTSLLMSMLFLSLSNSASNNIALHIMIDDIGELGHIPHFHDYLMILHGYNSSIVIFTMTMARLQRVYSEEWMQILFACELWMMFVMCEEDIKFFANRLGNSIMVIISKDGNSAVTQNVSNKTEKEFEKELVYRYGDEILLFFPRHEPFFVRALCESSLRNGI